MILDIPNSLDEQCHNLFDSVECARPARSASMAKKPTKAAAQAKVVEQVPGQSERLRRLRMSIGYDTASGFAVFLGTSVQRYSNFENGMPLSREIAFRLVQRVPGLSLDWLYFGKSEGLPIELARRLGVFDPPGKRTTG